MFNPTRLALAAAAASLGLVATTAPTAALPAWRTTATIHESDRVVRVLDLRYAEHPRFDRVVIDLRGRDPGYEIRYTRHLYYDGSGEPVRLAGKRRMSLVLKQAYGHTDSGEGLYEGPRKVYVHLPTLKGIAFTGDFEGYVSFGFSTDRRAPYRIFRLSKPSRLVVDWKH